VRRERHRHEVDGARHDLERRGEVRHRAVVCRARLHVHVLHCEHLRQVDDHVRRRARQQIEEHTAQAAVAAAELDDRAEIGGRDPLCDAREVVEHAERVRGERALATVDPRAADWRLGEPCCERAQGRRAVREIGELVLLRRTESLAAELLRDGGVAQEVAREAVAEQRRERGLCFAPERVQVGVGGGRERLVPFAVDRLHLGRERAEPRPLPEALPPAREPAPARTRLAWVRGVAKTRLVELLRGRLPEPVGRLARQHVVARVAGHQIGEVARHSDLGQRGLVRGELREVGGAHEEAVCVGDGDQPVALLLGDPHQRERGAAEVVARLRHQIEMRRDRGVVLAHDHARRDRVERRQHEVVVAVDVDREQVDLESGRRALEDRLERIRARRLDARADAMAVVAVRVREQLGVAFGVGLDQHGLPALLRPEVRRIREMEAVPRAELDARLRAGSDQLEDPREDAVLAELRVDVGGVVGEARLRRHDR
jgi:hypothetical protein